MKPVLFSILGLEIHSYGLMLAVAFLVGIISLGRQLKRNNVNDITLDTVIDLGIWILIGAILGARLAYVVTEYQYFLKYPIEILKLSSGGLAFHGGLLGGFVAGVWFAKIKGLSPWRLADLVAPYIALGYALVRVGCLLNGCCYGKTSAAPWALRCALQDSLLRHPTQMYSLISSLIIFFILLKFSKHQKFPGFLFVLYICLYSVFRFVVEFFREGPMVYQWLSLAQVVCLILGIMGLGIIGIQQHRYKKGRIERDAASEINS